MANKVPPASVSVTTEPAKPRLLPSGKVQFLENAFAAMRTAGALLLGNSALIYFGIVGAHADAFQRPLLLGLASFLVFSIPLAAIERNAHAAKALKSTNSKGN